MAGAGAGPCRGRPLAFLRVLALLLGALGLCAAAPAAAQTWSAMLTVKAPDGDRGCYATTGDHACTTALDDDDFTVDMTSYNVFGLIVSETSGGTRYLYLYLDKKIPDAVKALKLCLGTRAFALSDGTLDDDTPANDKNVVQWNSASVSGIPSWSVGDTVPVSLASSCEPVTAPAEVTLSADDTTPVEGATVTLTATLDAAAPADGMTLTLTVLERVSQTIQTTATATADYTLSPAAISIAAGETAGTATLAIVDDEAVEDNWYAIAGERVVLRAESASPALASPPLIVTILDNDGPFAGHRPGQPALRAVTSGSNAPTDTTLSFMIGCVGGGGSPVTDYVLWAENVADETEHYRLRVAPPEIPGCVTFGPATLAGLPSRTTETTYRVRVHARSLMGFWSPDSDAVVIATTANGQQIQGAGAGDTVTANAGDPVNGPDVQGSPGTGPETVAVGRYDTLIAQMRAWRNDPDWVHARAHTDRWDRALKAFGETVPDDTLTAMTAAEAQAFADRDWTRWVEVAEALREIESARAQTPATVPVVTIAAGSAVTEGASAGFTLTAAPAPAADLSVSVTVSQSGAVAQASALGARAVTIPAGQASASFTVATVDDSTDEPDGAVAAALGSGSGYTVGDAARAEVAVADNDEPLPAIVTKRGIAREGSDEAVVFTVLLDRASTESVFVDYETADGTGAWARTQPATAGADYTARAGTLVFFPGQTVHRLSVAILDDAIDEGTEYFLLRFSNPGGATLAARHRETQGLIRNADPLQVMWLARFGRTVGSQVADAVSGRLGARLSPGARVTLAGQTLDLGRAVGGSGPQGKALTGLARAFGASEAPANDDGPFARPGLAGAWDAPPSSPTAARSMTGREVSLGSAFDVAGKLEDAGAELAAWGRVTQTGFDGAHADDTGSSRVDGEVVTGVLGADADFGGVLAGVAVSWSEGKGTFDAPGVDKGRSGTIDSTMTTVSPYARFLVTERVSAWGLAGFGYGDMTIRFGDGAMAPVRTDLTMQLGALGARGAILEQDEAGGMDLALKADAFFVAVESKKAANSAATRAEASRHRLVLEGGRSFALSGTETLRPSLELGVRHDGGDAETGAGAEVGGGIAWHDASSGLGIEAKGRMLVTHADSDYREWGASVSARLDPGADGRGLSFSLRPAVGATSRDSERLWGAQDARGLAPGTEFEATRGFSAEAGFGLPLLDDRFTGTPSLAFGMSDGGARDYRIGWRLTSVVSGFEVRLDATRRETANDHAPPEHGVLLKGVVRW